MSEKQSESQQPETAEMTRDRSPHGAGDNNSQRGSTSRRKLSVPTEEQCLAALVQIPAMMLTGMLNTTQANVTKGVYATALQHLRQPKSTSNNSGINAPSLIDILRQNRSMIDSLEPMLTQEQFKEIKKQVSDENEAA